MDDDSWWQSWKKSGFDLDHFRKTLPVWAVLLLVVIANLLFWFWQSSVEDSEKADRIVEDSEKADRIEYRK